MVCHIGVANAFVLNLSVFLYALTKEFGVCFGFLSISCKYQ